MALYTETNTAAIVSNIAALAAKASLAVAIFQQDFTQTSSLDGRSDWSCFPICSPAGVGSFWNCWVIIVACCMIGLRSSLLNACMGIIWDLPMLNPYTKVTISREDHQWRIFLIYPGSPYRAGDQRGITWHSSQLKKIMEQLVCMSLPSALLSSPAKPPPQLLSL